MLARPRAHKDKEVRMSTRPPAYSRGITRRRLVGGAAVAGAAVALPAGVAAASARGSFRREVEVVVVGAGISGLAAARKLQKAGRSVVVLEANHRLGGRVLNLSTGPRPNQVTEAGGEWVAKRQTRILALMKELGITKFHTYTGGDTTYYDGSPHPFSGTFPPIPGDAKLALGAALTELDELSKTIDLEAPEESPNAGALDATTVESWLKDNVVAASSQSTRIARDILRVAVGGPVGGTSQGQSLLQYLFIAASSGGPLELVKVDGGALEFRIKGGSGLIVARLARKVGEDNIELKTPVRRIEQPASGVNVVTDNGVYRARRVIVAVAPNMAGQIDYDPPLGDARALFMQRAPMGWLIKCFGVYRTPFWREKGLNGMVNSIVPPLDGVFDNSPEDGSVGCLYGLIGGYNARRWSQRPAVERQRAVLGVFSRCFGSEALRPVKYMEYNWASNPWIRGGAAMSLPPSVMTEFPGVIRKPARRIHWASTETATESWGDMDGAITAGERAAAEIISG
jgi:monoamine oxidase